MGSIPGVGFLYEVEKSTDERSNAVTTIKCRGRIVSDTAAQLKEVVKPLIGHGGRILLDLGEVTHLDSVGLGTLVGLKASAIHAGYCRLELSNASQRIMDLLRITKLTQMFAS